MSSQDREQGSYFQFLPQQRASKAEDQGRRLLPTQPQLPKIDAGPESSPSAPQAQTHIPGGDEGGAQPQLQQQGRGVERLSMAALLAQPARPQPLGKVLPPPAGCCSPAGWGEARSQGSAGPGKTSHQGQERGDAALLGGLFPGSKLAAPEGDQGGKDGEWHCRASGSHSGFATTFAISRQQEADSKKKGVGAWPTVMYTRRKEWLRSTLHLTLLPIRFHSEINAGDCLSVFQRLHGQRPFPSVNRDSQEPSRVHAAERTPRRYCRGTSPTACQGCSREKRQG